VKDYDRPPTIAEHIFWGVALVVTMILGAIWAALEIVVDLITHPFRR
jgi:hypothetical protein